MSQESKRPSFDFSVYEELLSEQCIAYGFDLTLLSLQIG